jgi:GT2 family glycosyltransferase
VKIELLPFKDIERVGEHYRALSTEAMFEIRFARKVPAGAWLRWRYRTSYLDQLIRPLLCYELPTRLETDPMAAPLFGEAEWVGQIPGNCRRVFLKPVDRAGPFTFSLVKCQRVLKAALMPRAFRNSLLGASQSIGAEFIMAPRESRQALLYARQGVPLERYSAWRRRHFREYDPAGIDRPDPTDVPSGRFEILVWNDGAGSEPLAESPLVRSLRAQSSGNWRCTFFGFPESGAFSASSNFQFLPDPAGLPASDGSAPPFFFIRLSLRDRLAPFAIAALNRHVRQSGVPDVLYADEEVIESGENTAVRLKPDWSPIFEKSAGYIGRAVFWNGHSLARAAIDIDSRFDGTDWRRMTFEKLPAPNVTHLRRVILSGPPSPAAPAIKRSMAAHAAPDCSVRVIIPSKNAFNLIKACLAGLDSPAAAGKLEIVVVDNGSTDEAVLELYRRYSGRGHFQLLPMPGKFNYSRMCNHGAAGAKEDILLFLNNDISMPNDTWLAPLVRLAQQENIGAVGPRLLFPSGKLQHVGVTLGMGGYAAHQYDNAERDEPGHLGRLRHTHELSAVTGACIAVERRKFEQVGGFDEENLPVELNDIDFCLRLNEAGYQTVFCPDSELVHHQSASRGFSYRPFTRYGRERDWFKTRWEQATRDDPYFHPAFSLYSTRIALDG